MIEHSAQPFTFLYTVRAKPGREDDTKSLLLSLVTASRYESGNVNYELYEAADGIGMFCVYSVWVSKRSFDVHHESPAVKNAISRFSELAEGNFQDGARVLVQIRPAP